MVFNLHDNKNSMKWHNQKVQILQQNVNCTENVQLTQKQ